MWIHERGHISLGKKMAPFAKWTAVRNWQESKLGWRIDTFFPIITVALLRWTEFLQVWPYRLIFPKAHMTMMLFPDSRMRRKLCIYTELSESKCKWVCLNRAVAGEFPEEQKKTYSWYIFSHSFAFYSASSGAILASGTQIIEICSSLLLTFCWNPSFNQNKKHFQSVNLIFSCFQANACACRCWFASCEMFTIDRNVKWRKLLISSC